MKVLLVEDNALNSEFLADLLEAHSLLVTVAATGEECLRLVEQDPPDLILMDISLPGMSGLETARRLQECERLRVIPVVAVTAHVLPGDRERILEAGCIGYISKPIDVKTFVHEIRQYVPRA